MKLIKDYNKFLNEDNNTPSKPKKVDTNKINKYIDYTIVKPGTSKDDVKNAIDVAIENGYYSIVVEPDLVDFAYHEIEDDELKVVCMLGLTDEKMKQSQKINEVIRIIANGASEIDLVIDINDFKKKYKLEEEEDKKIAYVTLEDEIRSISNECHKNGVILKVIAETGKLTLEELTDISKILTNGNVDFIQTSSGNNEVGAELSKIKEMRRILPDYIKIKASGGIRTLKQANEFYTLVDRIGTSVVLK